MIPLRLIRIIDKVAGIPLCFLVTQIYRISKLLGLQKKPKDIKKILFIELSEMGSTIPAYSSMQKARQLFPKAEIYFLIFKENAESIRILDTIDNDKIITITNKSLMPFALDIFKATLRLRKEKIDVALDLELFARFSSIMTYLSGAKIRVGYNNFYSEGLYRGNFQTHNVLYNQYNHISLNYLSLVYSLIAPPGEYPLTKRVISKDEVILPKINITQDDKRNIFNKLKQINPMITEKNKIVIFNPSSGNLLHWRTWPTEHYVELAKKLLKDKDVFIVTTGYGDFDKIITSKFHSLLPNERCIELVNKTTLKELVSLYHISKLFVTADSGPAHFASLSNVKTYVFFGPETPVIYKPLGKNITVLFANLACSPCLSAFNDRNSPCNDNKCVQVITPDMVYNLVKMDI